MKPCALCAGDHLFEDLPFCGRCMVDYEQSPEFDRQYLVWARTGAEDRPNPDPWIAVYEASESEYVRRVQLELAH